MDRNYCAVLDKSNLMKYGKDHLVNYICSGIRIKMTFDQGRGVYATRDLEPG